MFEFTGRPRANKRSRDLVTANIVGVVNVTLTLAGSKLAFKAHLEEIGKLNSGNFLAVVDLLNKYSPVLREMIGGPKFSTKYLSPKIQN